MPKAEETATLAVGGRKFEDWESVWVQHRWADSCPLFKFSCAERDPAPELWETLQFKPGDDCVIQLGGQVAIVGIIVTRQVAYDGNNHAVQLMGKGQTWWAARASVIHETGNFDGKNFKEIAEEVLAPFPVGMKVVGELDNTPFARLSVDPGKTVWDFLEGIARPRGIVLGSDHLGNFLLIGDHTGSVVEQLNEGDNILRCQCVISKEAIYNPYIIRGQTNATDEQHGKDASEQEARAPGTSRLYSPILTPAEQPVWNIAEIAARAQNEAVWHQGTEIQATVTVQGWLRSGQALWLPGDNVHVSSPMAMLDQVMKIQTATFTQDSGSGTLTTLELVSPWFLKDKINYDVGRPGVPQAPGLARATSTEAFAAPPNAVPREPPTT